MKKVFITFQSSVMGFPGVCAQLLSHVPLIATPGTVAHQPPLSMEFSMQEHWSELPFPSLGFFLTQGWIPSLLHLQVDFLLLSHQGSPRAGIASHQCYPQYKQPYKHTI